MADNLLRAVILSAVVLGAGLIGVAVMDENESSHSRPSSPDVIEKEGRVEYISQFKADKKTGTPGDAFLSGFDTRTGLSYMTYVQYSNDGKKCTAQIWNSDMNGNNWIRDLSEEK